MFRPLSKRVLASAAMRRLASLSLLLLCASAWATPPAPRIDGRLRLAAAGVVSAREMAALAGHGRVDGRFTVSARVMGGVARLRALGFEARGVGGESAYVDVDAAELARLEAVTGLRAVEHTHRLWPTLDRSVAACGVPPLREALGLDGHGVVVGIVDTGIDFRHADFRHADGTTRIAALLDATSPRAALHPELPDYNHAALWLAADLDGQLAADATGAASARPPVTERDTNGHGTHVAGIAASNGLATARGLPDARYIGMAPDATLVVANATRDGQSFTEEDILAAVRFVYDRAAALGQPAVVNLSLGSDGGPHDGSTNFERAVSALVPEDEPGRALVIAAGNSGAEDGHAGGWLLDGGELVRLQVGGANGDAQSTSGDAPLSTLDLWFDGPPPAITLESPAGRSYGPVKAGATFDQGGSDAPRVRIDSASAGADSENQRYEVVVVLSGPGAAGTWSLRLRGTAHRWDAWTVTSGAEAPPRFLDHLDADDRGNLPAQARSAITVGSYVTRVDWPTVDGRIISRGSRGVVPGLASAFSGTGPTADGRYFPDLAAPGEFIVSALSHDAPSSSDASVFHVGDDLDYTIADDGLHGVLRGTSQAAPHVTGAIALLFQLDPTLTTSHLRELLRASARVAPGDPGYSPRTGFGQLDVGFAVALLQRSATGPVDALRSSVGLSRDAVPPGERVVVSVVPRDGLGAPLGPGHAVTIACDGGHFDGPARDLGEGRWERTLVADGARGSALTVTATVDGVALASEPTVWLVADRSEIGRPVRGGCSVGARGSFPLWLAALLALAWLGSARRRKA